MCFNLLTSFRHGSKLLPLYNEKADCMTALHYAVYYDQPEVAEVLLSKPAADGMFIVCECCTA